MPFTPAHAIVAVPFARTPIPAGAVAIGAMAPDLPLFFPWTPGYELTHGWPSLLWTSVPTALALYAVWRLAIRPAASGLIPRSLAARLPVSWDAVRRPADPVRSGAFVLAAVAIGVATHVFWDLFTHPRRLGSEWIPAIGEQWGPLDGTSWLQFASSGLGLAGLAIGAAIALRRAPVFGRDDPDGVRAVRVAGWLLAGVVLVASFTIELALQGIPGGYRELRDLAFPAGTRAGAAILLIALLASLAVQVVRARARP